MKVLEKILDKAQDTFERNLEKPLYIVEGISKHYDPKGETVYSKLALLGLMSFCVGEIVLYEKLRAYIQ